MEYYPALYRRNSTANFVLITRKLSKILQFIAATKRKKKIVTAASNSRPNTREDPLPKPLERCTTKYKTRIRGQE